MAESVGGDVFGDAGEFGIFFNHALDGTSGDAAIIARDVWGLKVAAVVKKERWQSIMASGKVIFDTVGSGFTNEHRAIFVAFTTNHKFAAFEVDRIAI